MFLIVAREQSKGNLFTSELYLFQIFRSTALTVPGFFLTTFTMYKLAGHYSKCQEDILFIFLWFFICISFFGKQWYCTYKNILETKKIKIYNLPQNSSHNPELIQGKEKKNPINYIILKKKIYFNYQGQSEISWFNSLQLFFYI